MTRLDVVDMEFYPVFASLTTDDTAIAIALQNKLFLLGREIVQIHLSSCLRIVSVYAILNLGQPASLM